jgi:hypothetical protein
MTDKFDHIYNNPWKLNTVQIPSFIADQIMPRVFPESWVVLSWFLRHFMSDHPLERVSLSTIRDGCEELGIFPCGLIEKDIRQGMEILMNYDIVLVDGEVQNPTGDPMADALWKLNCYDPDYDGLIEDFDAQQASPWR